jgi:polar amino acid transport system substrate-binding protein
MMKTLCIVCVVLLCGVNANAETYLFVTSEFGLLSEETEHGEFRGIAVELAKTIAERLGHTIRIEFYPWKRAQQMIKDGQADALIPPFKTPEREQWLDFMEIPLAPSNGYFFAPPGSTFVWDGDLSSLKEYTIGIPLGWSLGPEIEQAKAFLSIDYAPNIDMCLKKLLAHRVDLVPSPLQEVMASAQRLGLRDDQMPVRILPPFAENGAYLAFSKQKHNELAGLKKDFDRVLKEMKESGERARVLAKYGWPK